jgi:hypothetical protein
MEVSGRVSCQHRMHNPGCPKFNLFKWRVPFMSGNAMKNYHRFLPCGGVAGQTM